MKALRTKKLNHAITARVIALHGQGYTDDFLPAKDQTFMCLQNSENFALPDLQIQMIGQGFDQLTNTYKYIHTIETITGSKGLLISDFICTQPFAVN
ncbi:hypothetical protein [Mucilaginibacter phyllosphaerae]|uniref:Uncharacterized protein n=1 Tax=Mucilaginibacter phyllosphaerae TaxID=1812349 RepID=A0A4Y8A5W1_9SPHI|nr:hypothetical protein [Mucilaginibacter phyllosphaerae]MBB3971005.1 hypothetical protein [Mucilaginibacter phyllosphaerae]TEW63749.1 hypothetical protein E2R65_18435 [Mucilaginibacter phyllosphaerae]GGH21911.1 hypothetical protein GCM10007352_34900 [Mucilaginibacter phyllosphaerae]